ncbi:MAG: molecular chaperone HtpG [Deltaproteobacteria bacterium]
MGTDSNRHEFRAEVQQLLDLMIHSLYSNKDVFLRELISNASDALDRLRFESLTNEALRSDRAAEIHLKPDAEARTLTISDNGIGMSRDEVVENLGTIARSGTKEFLSKLKEAKENSEAAPELIGQFGVGFYSSFMVAAEVEVITRRAGEEKATRWASQGDGGYDLEDAERDEPGTTITLKLKDVDEDNHVRDYTEEWVLRDIVKRYSDFVSYPVKVFTWTEKEEGAKVLDEKTLNSGKAIWAKNKSEVTDEEYNEFYKHISRDWNEPLAHIPVKIEGTFEAQALLYLPERAPFDLFHPEMKRGVQLYVKRVFIMDECKELMPAYLRFVKGVVDAQDLSLNVSREILQKDRQIAAIRKQLVKKTFDKLEEIRGEDREKYDGFWSQFGGALKEGLVNGSDKEQARILELMQVRSTHDVSKWTTLAEYVERMKEGQDAIYYLAGPSLDAVKNSPHLEGFKAKGYEVVFLVDPIDEIWMSRGLEYGDKKFVSAGKGDVDLGTEEEKAEAEKAREEKEREHKDLLSAIRSYLQDDVKEVRLSGRLTASAACLVGDEGDLTPQMEKLMKQLGQEVPKTKRILELNPDHGVLARLQSIYDEDKGSQDLETYAKLLYGQSILAEGGVLEDPAEFSRLVTELMTRAT